MNFSALCEYGARALSFQSKGESIETKVHLAPVLIIVRLGLPRFEKSKFHPIQNAGEVKGEKRRKKNERKIVNTGAR